MAAEASEPADAGRPGMMPPAVSVHDFMSAYAGGERQDSQDKYQKLLVEEELAASRNMAVTTSPRDEMQWEGVLQKKGNSSFMERWKDRFVRIHGATFEYYEDKSMKKLLGEVPLEMAKWAIKPGDGSQNSVLEVITIGRGELHQDEVGGRDFFFRLHAETDATELINVLARACYLRNRQVMREACSRGDAYTLMQLRDALREAPGERARDRSTSAAGE